MNLEAIRMNKCVLALLVWFALAGAGLAERTGPTAYEAIQVLRQVRGEPALAQLVEVRGVQGGHQPESWTLVLNDPAARGGVRELVVANGVIVSERTPLRGQAGVSELPPLDFSKLNLDSSGAFRQANSEAARKNTGFHWLDYYLRMDQGRPVWTVYLDDYSGARVGVLRINADTGRSPDGLQLDPGRGESTAQSAPYGERRLAPGGVIGAVEDTARRTTESVSRGTLRVIGTVQEWLTGERTIGNEED